LPKFLETGADGALKMKRELKLEESPV
jgi:hypothetical protein